MRERMQLINFREEIIEYFNSRYRMKNSEIIIHDNEIELINFRGRNIRIYLKPNGFFDFIGAKGLDDIYPSKDDRYFSREYINEFISGLLDKNYVKFEEV